MDDLFPVSSPEDDEEDLDHVLARMREARRIVGRRRRDELDDTVDSLSQMER